MNLNQVSKNFSRLIITIDAFEFLTLIQLSHWKVQMHFQNMDRLPQNYIR
jgi:hypothetical protein